MAWSAVLSFAHDGYRTIIPYPEDRIPLTAYNHWSLAIALLPTHYMAYLARRPDTYLLRLMLLPVAVLAILGTFFRLKVGGVDSGPQNWGLGSLALVNIAKAIDYGWRREGMLKVGEEKPGIPMKTAHHSNGNATPNGERSPPPPIWKKRLPSWLYDILELHLPCRGIGWKVGAGLYIPKEHRPLERSAFLSATMTSALENFLVFDACESFIKLVPGVGSPQGGTIFRPELPFLQRYILSTVIHVATGSCILAGFELCYHILTLIGVGLLSHEPSSWPPIMDNPWQSDSLHVFWAKRWHQLLRETFFIYGGFVGGALAGNLGALFGTFFGSGLYHEVAAYCLGHGFDYGVIFFFALQAPLMILEKLWARTTGCRIKGIYGRLWVYFCIIILGQPLVDSWHKRGLGGGYIIDPNISPIRLLLIPFLRQVAGFLGLRSLSVLLG
ncbi:hypothetical protein V8B97DRAFT_2022916 [Scleroderma yunnanense]